MSEGRRLRMVDLAARLVVAKSAVTKTVDRLEQRGLLQRQRDNGDRRTIYAVLTPVGEEILEQAKSAYLASVERHFASRLERSVLRQLLQMPEQVLAS